MVMPPILTVPLLSHCRLQLEPGAASSSYTVRSLNDFDPIVDDNFAATLRMEATLALMHVTEHNDISNQHPLTGTKLSKTDGRENHVENHPFNETLFYDNPQKEVGNIPIVPPSLSRKNTFDTKV